MKGRIWRIGLMGASSTQRNVTLMLAALETILARNDGLKSAGAVYAKG